MQQPRERGQKGERKREGEEGVASVEGQRRREGRSERRALLFPDAFGRVALIFFHFFRYSSSIGYWWMRASRARNLLTN